MLRALWLLFKQVFLMDIKDCLIRKVDPLKIEEAFDLEHQEFYGKPRQTFGRKSYFMEYKWNPFIAKMLKGDELWFYRLPAEFWQHLQGHQGYVLIRNGKIVAKVMTIQN